MPQLGKCARATPRQPAGRLARGSANLGSESGLTERRTLPNRWAPECAFPSRRDRRMRFSVRVHAQNALFRKMRFSSPGQTWRRLTEKRILQPASHGKAHSATVMLPKSALCDTPLEVRSHGVRLSVRNGDTHPRHTRRLLTSQTHKAGHPNPHCHLALSVPVTLPLDPERSCPARSPSSGSVSCTATRPRAYLSHCHSALNVPLRYD